MCIYVFHSVFFFKQNLNDQGTTMPSSVCFKPYHPLLLVSHICTTCLLLEFAALEEIQI